MWCEGGGGGGLVKVCIFHNKKMHVYLIILSFLGVVLPSLKVLDLEGFLVSTEALFALLRAAPNLTHFIADK